MAEGCRRRAQVCADWFDNLDAKAACKQLGFNNAAALVNSFGAGSVAFSLSGLQCTGAEASLVPGCATAPVSNPSTCSHGAQDAAIACWRKAKHMSSALLVYTKSSLHSITRLRRLGAACAAPSRLPTGTVFVRTPCVADVTPLFPPSFTRRAAHSRLRA